MSDQFPDEQVLILTSAIERALRGDFAGAAGLDERLSARLDLPQAGSLPHLASRLSDLIQLLRERESTLENHAEELRTQNEDLAAALAAAEQREQELSDLYEVAQAITSRLDQDELVLVLEQKIKSLLNADTCSLLIHDPAGRGLQVIGPGMHLSRRTLVQEHQDVCEFIAMRVATTGQSGSISDVPNCSHCRYRDLMCGKGVHHMLSVPMRAQDRLIGAVNAFRMNKQPFNESDERKLSIMAGAAAVALENAEAYRREHDIAEKLQRGIQPSTQFTLRGFSVGCNYIPATVGSSVGGDFYDIVDLGGGRFGIVIADISGKGIDAAMYMAMARFTLRGLMLVEPDPAVVLRRLNEAVCSFVPDEIFITMFYGVIDTPSCDLHYANAGHDQPLVFAHSDCSCMTCEVTGHPLGMVSDEIYTSCHTHLDPGDLIALFTDGITEARRGTEFFGVERIQNLIIGNADGSASELVSTIFEDVQQFAGGKLRDDAGLLVLKVLTPSCEVDMSSATA